ncbi:hypothetical protein [Streptomyces lutosisoli]|uniref:Uncharacterized protein n=1 Tax=Streptomyces lutosisoli TaxID=2665721 RepID=A0ABW2VVI7_9ACTN
MTRRITWTLLALTSVLLVLAVVPLAVLMTARERVAFRDDQRAATDRPGPRPGAALVPGLGALRRPAPVPPDRMRRQ